ncbi:mandelate racemase/muconate lactonizing enzyme family protein [uncultured Paludibaculum sp.]|uniref:mandelate racemase/muconate lactonizing enzyme family protein n=1 Tax=uncultured Paludibaculum sp. TaxID=1765020 RepID=UPI002AAB86C0|nr:mandelate racemase/muconate lactonizing enzyme family protein [uncultured Paludibaculum sp.]
MKADRRSFLSATVGGALASQTSGAAPTPAVRARFEKLDAVLKQPVLKKQLFSSPVIIESVELLHLDGGYLCRVRSKDGAEGISVAHSSMNTLFPIFLKNVQPFFLGKDARELDLILEKVYVFGFNFRLDGLALGLPLATIEFAILEMLGRMAKKPVGELIGEIHNREVGVYMATEWREKPVEESLKLIQGAVAEYDVHALKIKIGGLMFMTTDMYAVGPPGRTERMIPLIRKTFGDKMALYADSNGFYTVPEAIRVGRLLEEYKYVYFEEPVMFDYIEDIKEVADALTIPIANGEQDHSFHGFRWLLANDGLDIVQPDNYYFGGLIRSMKVARMAAAFGKTIVPHMSGGGLGFLYDIQFVSAVPNAGEHHEFKSFKTHVRFECKTSPLKVVDGKIKVPTGPGFGADLDPDWVKKHQPVRL